MVALYYQGYIKREGMNGGLGFVLASSRDGGSTWTDHPIPFGACAGKRHLDAVSNGRVAVGPDGTTYVATAVGDGISPIRLVLTASPDGGQSWTVPTIETMKSDVCHADEPSVTADPASPGRAYAVWTDACWPQHSFLGISTTSDGGKTWTKARDVSLAPYSWVNWPTIVADPGSPGTLHLVFSDCKNGSSTSYTVVAASSSDGGATWGSPVIVAKGPGGYGPDPSAALAPDGSLYVAWDTSQGLSMSESTDAGRDWSPARTVATTSERPSLAISSSGVLAIAFEPNSMILSSDRGQTFSEPEPFSDLGVPAGFAGDYTIASLADGTDFHAVFECTIKDTTSTCFW